MADREALRINPERMQADFGALAQIGATAAGGVHRPALSAAHLQARAWLEAQIVASWLELRCDSAGNRSGLLACGPEGAPTLLLGSHLDSVPDGGAYDGALGIVAALEVLRTVKEHGLRLPYHLEVIDFTDEEGALVGLLGSRALAGSLQAGELAQPRGGRAALLEGLQRAGLSEAGLLAARRHPAALAGYLELHIEQGPRLIQAGAQIGVVSAIVGISSLRLTFHGRANHAGTTPMTERRDAAQGAAAFILAARRLVMADFPGCVANVGQARLLPGAFNIVPERAELALELRAAHKTSFRRLEKALLELGRACAGRYGLSLTIEKLGKHPPTALHPRAQAAIRAAAGALGLRWLDMPSGAGHDAQSLAALCPAGMIFIPSQGGVSHAPDEFSAWQDCVNGANVLLGAALRWGDAMKGVAELFGDVQGRVIDHEDIN